jgi:hypothetical protein
MMPAQPPKSKQYWVDELDRKHEGSPFDDSDAEVVTIQHEGQPLRLIVRQYTPPVEVKVTASCGDMLFLLGKQLDEETDDGHIIEGGDGILMVARRHEKLESTYWVAVCHNIFPEALRRLLGEG